MTNNLLQLLLLGLLDHGVLRLGVRVGGQAGLREELDQLPLSRPDRRGGLLRRVECGKQDWHRECATLQHAREQNKPGAGGRCVQVVVEQGQIPDQRPTSQQTNTAFAAEKGMISMDMVSMQNIFAVCLEIEGRESLGREEMEGLFWPKWALTARFYAVPDAQGRTGQPTVTNV